MKRLRKVGSQDMVEDTRDDTQEAFEKARFDYCWLVHESEVKRQQQIETKIQFYLSLVTLFLGVVFFNFGSISRIGELFGSGGMPAVAQYAVVVALLVLAASLVTALVSILQAYRLLKGSSFYPKKFHDALFDRTEGYLQQENTRSLYYMNARSLAIAVEAQRGNNQERTKWLFRVQSSIVVAIFALTVIISVLIIYTLS